MKRKIMFAIIGIALVVLMTAITIGLFVANRVAESTENSMDAVLGSPVDYHLMILVNDSDDAYKDSFLAGVVESSAEHRIAYEIVRVDSSNYEESLLDALDMAIYAGADGIALDAIQSARLTDKIMEASEAGIPVFTMNEDLPESGQISYIGTGRQTIGMLAASIFESIFTEEADVAVIEQSVSSSLVYRPAFEDELIAGIEEQLEAEGRISLSAVSYTERGILSAESAATELFSGYPDIDGIFCDNGKNTLGTIQFMLEKNLVNKLVLVGSGNEGEILEYIQKGGIIDASIVIDNHDVGYQVVRAFADYMEGKTLSDHISTNVEIIDKDNVEAFINESDQ